MDKGICMATGDIFAVLNADDCYREGVLGKVAAAFARHSIWDGPAGDMVFVDGDGKEIFQARSYGVDKL